MTAITELVTTDHPVIQARLQQDGFKVIKKAQTLARLPTTEEIGKRMLTWVDKGDGPVEESGAKVTANHVIGRNPEPLSNGQFNEWPIENPTFMENYGKLPDSHEFSPFKKMITNTVVMVDEEILNVLGSEDGKSAQLGISWDENGMLVQVGDYLFDAGYAVDKREFDNTYEEVGGIGHAAPLSWCLRLRRSYAPLNLLEGLTLVSAFQLKLII